MTAPASSVRGTVYGTLLNFRASLAALGDAVNAPPYKAPPRAPVLYIKPANTWSHDGAPIAVPPGCDALEMGGSLGLVIGRTACRVPAADALDHVAGYVVVNDVSIPHTGYYRPSIRLKCRDGFCPIGPVAPRTALANPDAATIRVFVDGALRCEASTADLVRPAATLLEDVTEFMTLSPGDILMLGVPANAPRAAAGTRVTIEIAGVGRLENALVREGEA